MTRINFSPAPAGPITFYNTQKGNITKLKTTDTTTQKHKSITSIDKQIKAFQN